MANNERTSSKTRGFSFRKLLKRFIIGGMVFIILLVVALWIDHSFSTELPKPSGKYPVGRTTLYIDTGPGRSSATSQEVFAWVWYPAMGKVDTPTVYLPELWRAAFLKSTSPVLQIVWRDLKHVHTHSCGELPVATDRKRYPVILFRGGLSTLAPQYTSLAENWASNGYIVIGLDAPALSRIYVDANGRITERSSENNPEATEPLQALHVVAPRLARTWAANAGVVLDFLETHAPLASQDQWMGRIDLNQVVMIGHSLGGAAAMQFALQDKRCKAAIDIDGLVTPDVADSGLRIPVLFLMGEHPASELKDTVNMMINADLKRAWQHTPRAFISRVSLPAANHFNFSDGAVTRNHLLMGILRLFGAVKMDPVKQLDSTGKITVRFLDGKLHTRHRAGAEQY